MRVRARAASGRHWRSNEQTTFQQTDGIKRACIDKNVLNHICNKHPPNPLLNAAYHFICHLNAPLKALTMSSLGLWFLPCAASTALRGGEEAWRECLPLAHPIDRGNVAAWP